MAILMFWEVEGLGCFPTTELKESQIPTLCSACMSLDVSTMSHVTQKHNKNTQSTHRYHSLPLE